MPLILKKLSIKQWIVLLGVLVFSFGLGLFAYLGVFNRFYADDWCYNADFLELGLLGTLRGYSYITTYASNRFSLTLFSGLFERLGILGVQFITPFFIFLFLFSTYKLLNNLRKLWAKQTANSIIVLSSGIIGYFTIYLAPHIYQSFYWRSGLLPYTAPLVLTVLIFSLITEPSKADSSSRTRLIIIALLSFFGGGFSESGSAFLTTALLIYLSLVLFFRKSNSRTQTSLLPASIGLVFASLAMVLLIASPTSQMRLDRYGASATLFEFLFFTFSYSLEFIRSSFADLPIPHLVMMFTFFSLSVIARSSKTNVFKKRNFVWGMLVVAVIGFLLIAASYAPSAYIEKAPPALRTRIMARFTLTATIALMAWQAGKLALQYKSWIKPLTWIALSVLVFSFAYTIRSIGITFETKYPLYRERAEIWDTRDRLIKERKNEGITVIDVQGIDSLPIGGLRDLKENPNFWINACAARYYGVEAIQATLP